MVVVVFVLAASVSVLSKYPPVRLGHESWYSFVQVVRANMDSPTVAAATEGGSPFYKIYEIYLVRLMN